MYCVMLYGLNFCVVDCVCVRAIVLCLFNVFVRVVSTVRCDVVWCAGVVCLLFVCACLNVLVRGVCDLLCDVTAVIFLMVFVFVCMYG